MHRMVCIAAVAVIFCCCAGAQHTGVGSLQALSTDLVTIWITSDNETLPVFFDDGKPYLVGEQGRHYQIGLTNRSEISVEVVVAVDGRDVISGEMAGYRTHRGYVLYPGESVTLKGFRQDLSRVRAFVFGGGASKEGSPSENKLRSGVIGIAVFTQKDSSPHREKESLSSTGGQMAIGFPQGDNGTDKGDSLSSEAEFVPFKRQNPEFPSEVVALFYDERSAFAARGIVVPGETDFKDGDYGDPEPFPGVLNGEEDALSGSRAKK